MTVQIKNREAIATTTLRDHAISIMEAGYQAIDTEECIKKKIFLDGEVLNIADRGYDLTKYRSISVIGFGKASSKAAQSLEAILGERLTGGIVIDKDPLMCKRINVFQGSHPQPTTHNVEVSEKIASLAKGLTTDDLAIVIVSGGGSSLLCWPQSESDQGSRLYEDFLSAGGTINELNIIRKHLSGMKGGGLAKLLHPATVVGLIFCDVPGEHFSTVASGPTYYDESSISDAENLLKTYNINEKFEFQETPKDKSIFEKVFNVPIVSNVDAINAMNAKAVSLGYQCRSVGSEWYKGPKELIEKLLELSEPKTVVLGGGEPKMVVVNEGGNGGRNEYISSLMINKIPEDSVFISFSSDGIDNCSEAAGGIIDSLVKEKSLSLDQPVENYINDFKHDELLTKLEARIITGPTEANVSDLFLLISK